MLAHIPILIVVLPLVIAPVCLLFRSPEISKLLATIVSLFCVVGSLFLLDITFSGTIINYELGAWEPPWGIEYKIGLLGALIATIVSIIGFACVVFSITYNKHEIHEERSNKFYALLLLCLSGLLGMIMTNDIFNLFVFLEISSLSSYALVASSQKPKALWAAYRYLIAGTIGATFILLSIGMLYMMTGTLNMDDISSRLPDVHSSATTQAAFAFLTVGLSLKVALFPLHFWLPGAYTYAPSPISAFLAGTTTKVSLYVFIKFFFSLFGTELTFNEINFEYIMGPLSAAAIILASLSAIYQTNIKRMLAYSSIAQLGYMTLGISMATKEGLSASIIHLTQHAFAKSALFLALGCVIFKLGSANLDNLKGLGRRMPITTAAIIVGGLSMIGIPLTGGFISKWYLIQAAMGADLWLYAVTIVLGSVLALVYVGRVVELAFFKSSDEQLQLGEAPIALQAPVWLLLIANIYLGIFPDSIISVARYIAEGLF
jgi:multicomponent Na+:H+ antiporter subunit D